MQVFFIIAKIHRIMLLYLCVEEKVIHMWITTFVSQLLRWIFYGYYIYHLSRGICRTLNENKEG